MNIVKIIVDALRPNMKDHMDRGGSYWFDYENILDECLRFKSDPNNLVAFLNEVMAFEYLRSPANHAANDVATTLEKLSSETYSNKFIYF